MYVNTVGGSHEYNDTLNIRLYYSIKTIAIDQRGRFRTYKKSSNLDNEEPLYFAKPSKDNTPNALFIWYEEGQRKLYIRYYYITNKYQYLSKTEIYHDIEIMNTKLCRNCNTMKSRTEFSKAKNQPDGLQSACKSCYKNKYAPKRDKKFKRIVLNGTATGYAKPKYDREKLLQQIESIRKRESNPQTKSKYDYSFLWTNEKFLK